MLLLPSLLRMSRTPAALKQCLCLLRSPRRRQPQRLSRHMQLRPSHRLYSFSPAQETEAFTLAVILQALLYSPATCLLRISFSSTLLAVLAHGKITLGLSLTTTNPMLARQTTVSTSRLLLRRHILLLVTTRVATLEIILGIVKAVAHPMAIPLCMGSAGVLQPKLCT